MQHHVGIAGHVSRSSTWRVGSNVLQVRLVSSAVVHRSSPAVRSHDVHIPVEGSAEVVAVEPGPAGRFFAALRRDLGPSDHLVGQTDSGNDRATRRQRTERVDLPESRGWIIQV